MFICGEMSLELNLMVVNLLQSESKIKTRTEMKLNLAIYQ